MNRATWRGRWRAGRRNKQLTLRGARPAHRPPPDARAIPASPTCVAAAAPAPGHRAIRVSPGWYPLRWASTPTSPPPAATGLASCRRVGRPRAVGQAHPSGPADQTPHPGAPIRHFTQVLTPSWKLPHVTRFHKAQNTDVTRREAGLEGTGPPEGGRRGGAVRVGPDHGLAAVRRHDAERARGGASSGTSGRTTTGRTPSPTRPTGAAPSTAAPPTPATERTRWPPSTGSPTVATPGGSPPCRRAVAPGTALRR